MFRAAQVADASPDVKLSGILNPVLWNRQRRRRLRSGNSTAGSGAGILLWRPSIAVTDRTLIEEDGPTGWTPGVPGPGCWL